MKTFITFSEFDEMFKEDKEDKSMLYCWQKQLAYLAMNMVIYAMIYNNDTITFTQCEGFYGS